MRQDVTRDPGTSETSPPTPEAIRSALTVLPAVLELLETSPIHYMQPSGFLLDRILPGLLLGQYRLLTERGRPAAFVNWAWVNAELLARLERFHQPLTPQQWHCGDALWFCEIVVRDGYMHALMRDLQRNVFPAGTRGKWMRVGPSGELKGVGEVRIPPARTAAA